MSLPVCVRLKNGECALQELPNVETKGLEISGSVGVSGKNVPADVKAIQAALNRVPASAGGPSPALDVDGVVGPLTNGAISKFQKHQFGWADGRVDPDNITMATLRAFQPNAPNAPSGPPPTPRNGSTIPLVFATIPIAKRLIAGARKYVASSRDYLSGKASDKTVAGDRYAILNVFFSLDQLPEAQQLTSVNKIDGVFATMEKALSGAGVTADKHAIFQPDPLDQKTIYAYTYFGGFTRRDAKGGPKMSKDDNYSGPNLREDSIYICTGLDGKPGDFTAYNTVHELAHWVGPEIGSADTITDFSYRHKSDFYSLPPATALRTADSYAMFSVAASDRGLAEDAYLFMPPLVIHGSPPKK